jgi:Carboxypeptidase regulatory-like domain
VVALCLAAVGLVLAASGSAEGKPGSGGGQLDAREPSGAGASRARRRHRKRVARPSLLRGPALRNPADGERVDSLPAFSWSAVSGAAKYEFQLSADDDFGSVVLGQGRGSFQTQNTYATINKTIPNGTYHWRVRAIDRNDDAGHWSAPRVLNKAWTARPALLGPVFGAPVSYPREPLVLQWSRVPRAFKYLVEISTDPTLASLVVKSGNGPPETSATVFTPNGTLAPGRYYWAVTPEDAEKHKGTRSAIGSFDWVWPTATTTTFTDLNPEPRVIDPQLSWAPVAGAARYDVEINSSQDFTLGSKVCCNELTTGTSLSPRRVLPNNHYYWRVRALDLGGNAGVWNVGPSFEKNFDGVNPTIPGLQLRNNESALLPVGSTTDTPIVTWDPVPGASSYDVNVVPFIFGGCNWTSTTTDTWKNIKTAANAWTPLGYGWNGQVPGGVSYPTAATEGRVPQSGQSYCVRVAARTDRDAFNGEVVSDWTQLGGAGNPAFTYQAPTLTSPPSGTLTTPAENYRLPVNGTLTPRLPLFTWARVPGAASYFVVVAKDPSFTDIVDLGFTQVPAYAPRTSMTPKTYPDETTSYYWAVMPAKSSNGNNVTSYPWQNNPRSFEKRSTPPTLLSPGAGADILTQPTFRWTSTEGAREYRLQVAQDPTFSNPLDDVTTNATAYTSSTTYPADTVLYWRVRANDENKIGLTWSATGTFQRRLPAPALSPGNATGGETIHVINWSLVQGATSYEMHVDQSDGTTRDFVFGSTAFTPIIFYGTGIWQWKVRARFPRASGGEVSGPYSAPQAFTRRIDAPPNPRSVSTPGHVLLSWDPGPMTKEYRVQVSATDSFSTVFDTHTTENTDYAPQLGQAGYLNGGTLYWRVAAVDEGGNVGAWTVRTITLPKGMKLSVSGLLLHRRRGIATVTVTDARGRPVRGARVRASGAGAKSRRARTNRRGMARLRLRPRRRGTIAFRARKSGYQSARVTLGVI